MRSFVQEKSYGSVKVFWLDRERLLQALEEKAAELLATFPEVLAVVLFGSLARGEATPRSDADLLLLVGEAPPFLERPGRYLPLFADLGFPWTFSSTPRRRPRPIPWPGEPWRRAGCSPSGRARGGPPPPASSPPPPCTGPRG